MLFDLAGDRQPRAHFIGIGGAGMLAGARLAMEAGWEVRGSDGPLYPPASEMVERLGAHVYAGYEERNLEWNPDLVVIGNAHSRGHVEVEHVLRRRIPYLSLPEFIKQLVLWKRKPVVVAGTHGKTSTTALTAYLLRACGLEPGWFIGGLPLDLPQPSALGVDGGPFVIEGDEYDTAFFDKRAKFFHYLPFIAIVTSIELDHADIYQGVDEIEHAFRLMLRQVPRDGWLLACADDPRAAALVEHAPCRTQSYGFSEHAHWRGEYTGVSAGFSGLTIARGGRRFAELAVPLAGRHNLRNTIAAVAATSLLGATVDEIRAAIMQFRGVRRRMELFHEAGGVLYIDDFGHHPTAIRETIAAVRERWPGRRLRVLVEPRSNTMVRNVHQQALADALRGADEVYFGPIHRAERVPERERLDRAAVIAELARDRVNGHVFDDVPVLAEHILATGEPGDIVLLFSNGAFGGIYEMIRRAEPGSD